MAKKTKTNAMRILDQLRIDYHIFEYDNKDGKIDGISVANKIGQPADIVYKTLVAKGASNEYYVFVIPVMKELDLKLAAQAVKEKRVEMIPVKDITKVTGYIRGGCSPIGMKKHFKTIIDMSSNQVEIIIVSAGKIGLQIGLETSQLLEAAKGELASIVK